MSERRSRWLSVLLIVAIEAIPLLVLALTYHRCFDHKGDRPAAATQHGSAAGPARAGH